MTGTNGAGPLAPVLALDADNPSKSESIADNVGDESARERGKMERRGTPSERANSGSTGGKGGCGHWQTRTADLLLVRQEGQGCNQLTGQEAMTAAIGACAPACTGEQGNREQSTSPTPAGEAADCAPGCCVPLADTSPELRGIVEAWGTLPEAVRAGIVAMVREMVGGGRDGVR